MKRNNQDWNQGYISEQESPDALLAFGPKEALLIWERCRERDSVCPCVVLICRDWSVALDVLQFFEH